MKRRVLCALLASATLALPVHATVYVAASLAELVTDASAVVYGQVTATEARWLDGRRGIETLVTISVSESLKGSPGDTVSLRVPGGQLGPYRSILVGAPTLREGDEVVLFLASRGPAIPHLVGLSQGVYRVVVDSDSGRRTVLPELTRLAARGTPVRLVRGDPARRPTPLAEFTAQVRRLVAGDDQ
jgi:hypothetical protein